MKVDQFVKSIKEISYENPSINYFENIFLGVRFFVVLIFRAPFLNVVNYESLVRCTITSPRVGDIQLGWTSCTYMRTHKILIYRKTERTTTNPRLRTKSSPRGTSTGIGKFIFSFCGKLFLENR